MTSKSARPLAWRLSLTIATVAVAVVGLFAALMVLITRSDLNSMSVERAQHVQATLTSAAAFAYRSGDGWHHAQLQPVIDLARDVDTYVRIVDTTGRQVAAGGASLHEPTEPAQLSSIMDGHAVVGDVVLTFPLSNATPATAHLRTRLATAGLLVGALSVLLAVAVAVFLARRITRPLHTLTAAVNAVNDGETDVRVGQLSSALELEDLGAGFDAMAATLSRQDRLRKNLVADVAHELRTPVSVLQASCEAVVDGVTPPSRELAISMLEQVHRLGQRIADLDALTSAESAGLRLVRTPVAIDQVVQEAVDAARPRYEEAGVTLSTALAPATTVRGDRGRLHQVITNLLVNAVKFTPTGGNVYVAVTHQGSEAVIRVSDTGVGVRPDELEHVFDRFWRGVGSTGTPGSGVGLAIVSELVQAHRGTVTVESDIGHGTEFVVRLPLA